MAGQTTVIVQQATPTPPAKPPGARTYGELKQTHPDYDAELIDKLKLMRRGGWAILREAHRFIPKDPLEPEQIYNWRLKFTSYINKLAQVTGYIVGALNQAPLTVKVAPKQPKLDEELKTPPYPDEVFYEAFFKNCDRKRTDFAQFMRRATSNALIFGREVVGVDMPKRVEDAATAAEEMARGGGDAYLYLVDPAELINWEYVKPEVPRALDDQGQIRTSVRGFRWCVLRREYQDRKSPFDSSRPVPEFKVWTLSDDGHGVFTVYRPMRTLEPNETEYKDDDIMMIVDGGELDGSGVTSFDRIPLVCFEPPIELVVGEQAGPMCQEHFRRRSALAGSMIRSLVEIPVIQRGSEMGAPMGVLPSESQQDPNRGHDPVGQYRSQGFLVLGIGDEFKFVAPSGSSHQLASNELDKLSDDIHRITETMALNIENTAGAVKRSGESKKEDKSATEIVLDLLAKEVRECSEEVMETVSRGRLDPPTTWTATGLDSYSQENAMDVVAEAVDVQSLTIPSRTFKKLHAERVVRTVLRSATETQLRVISSELEDGFAAEETLQAAMRDSQIRDAEQPDETGTAPRRPVSSQQAGGSP